MKNKKSLVVFVLIIIFLILSLIFIFKNDRKMESIEIGNLTMSYYKNSGIVLDDSEAILSKEYYFEIETDKDTLYYVTLVSDSVKNNINNNLIMISLKKNGKYVIGAKNEGVLLSSFEGFDSLSTIGSFDILLDQKINTNSKDKYVLKVWIQDSNTSGAYYKLDVEVKEKVVEEKSPYIYLDSNEGELSVDKISLEDINSYLELPIPVKEGYEFKGWYTKEIGGTEKNLSDLKNIKKDIILYAQYEKIIEVESQATSVQESSEKQKQKYNISFNTNGGSKISSFKLYEGEKITMPNNPIKEGYTFKGWKENISYMPNKDIVFNAIWEASKYKITFDAITGTTDIDNKEITYDSEYGELPIAIKEGYKFLGWYTEETGGEKVESTDIVKITADTTLYAQYEANKYTLTLKLNDISSSTKEVIYDQEYGVLITPIKAGYTFKGWYTEKVGGEKVESTDIVKVTTDTTLYAQYEANKYTITFDVITGTTNIDNKEVTYDQEYGELPVATKEGYKFLGWYTEKTVGTKIESTDIVNIIEDTTLYAQYEANKYTITFDATIGTTDTDNKEVTYDQEYGELPVATKEDYPFKGWYTEKVGGEKVESTDIVKITTDTTLYAQYVLVPITSIDINFAEYSLLMRFGNYQIVATVLPTDAENQNLKYEIISNKYSGLTINENTGLISYVDNGSGGSCNSFTVKVSAQDGSGVYITRKLIMDKPNGDCWTPMY